MKGDPVPVSRVLYHYTCDERAAMIRASGVLRPGPTIFKQVPIVLWLTDLENPARRALGLTSQHLLTCDRITNRFVVPEPVEVYRWVDIRRWFPRSWANALETAPGAMPMHWYVTAVPQRFDWANLPGGKERGNAGAGASSPSGPRRAYQA